MILCIEYFQENGFPLILTFWILSHIIRKLILIQLNLIILQHDTTRYSALTFHTFSTKLFLYNTDTLLRIKMNVFSSKWSIEAMAQQLIQTLWSKYVIYKIQFHTAIDTSSPWSPQIGEWDNCMSVMGYETFISQVPSELAPLSGVLCKKGTVGPLLFSYMHTFLYFILLWLCY